MQPLDYLIVALYFSGVLAVGAWFAGQQKSLKDFFLGGRTVPWWGAAASGIATIVSGVTYLGGPGLAFSTNYHWHQARLAAPFGLLVLCGLLLPTFHRLGTYSIYEYLERRFDARTRLVAAGMFVVLKTGYLGVVIYAPSLVLAAIFDLPLPLVVLVTGLATAAYTQLGGIKAVIWTDALQLCILVAGVVAAIALVAHTLDGGIGQILAVAGEAGRLDYFNFSPSLSETYTFWGCLVGGTFMLVSQFGTDQAEVQRFLTTKSPAQANLAMVVTVIFTAVVGVTVFFVGTALFAFYTAFPEKGGLATPGNGIFPKFIVEEMPTGVKGLLVAGVLAASMSTISSVLNSLATVVVSDIVPRLRRTGALPDTAPLALLGNARRWTIFFGVVTTGLACFGGNLGNLLDATNRLVNLFGGSLLGVFLLGILNRRAGADCGVWALGAGLVTALSLQIFTDVSFMWFGPFSATIAFSFGSFLAWLRPDATRGIAAPAKCP